MKQSGRVFYNLLLVVVSVQLIISLALPISANAQSYRLSLREPRPLIGTTSQVPNVSQESAIESNPEAAPETNPGPPEPPVSFPEDPIVEAPDQEEVGEEIESSQESSASQESSSSEGTVEESDTASSDVLDETSTESDSLVPEDKSKTVLPVNQIAPGSLMIKPTNLLEPINIGSTVKRWVANYYDAATLSLRSGILIAHYLFMPAGEVLAPYVSNFLVSYFEGLLKSVIEA